MTSQPTLQEQLPLISDKEIEELKKASAAWGGSPWPFAIEVEKLKRLVSALDDRDAEIVKLHATIAQDQQLLFHYEGASKDKDALLVEAEKALKASAEALNRFADKVGSGDSGWIQLPFSECHRAGDCIDNTILPTLTKLKAGR